ncbi:hypothetical protein [Halorussus halophilus]|uniref:hypothetical protein n=1 Tax=Halorussus halophilus TaxID=2650975 RepID=UPI0017880581|nr:hypothetical protein [Halorussus halophilus]
MEKRTTANQDFEAELEELILSSFGSGEEIEGVWDLEFGPDEIPDWTVTVDRKDGL